MCKQIKTNKTESFRKVMESKVNMKNEEAMFWKVLIVKTKSKKKNIKKNNLTETE